MFTALMSLGLVGLVVVYGVVYSKTMDELIANSEALRTRGLEQNLR